MAGPLAAGLAVAGLAAGLALAPALQAGAAARGRQTIGGPQLAGHGVIVNYPSASARRLPHVRASAFVVADAGTGQVL
ncbi:MAG TPA: D-alanyl-D-alanine carboxypeptidase, partial [Streptosporangiaceae bacterium]|nr:D-alanyl-D-alanine carboxypeptidase [Streptosporangiaceae bacterium]